MTTSDLEAALYFQIHATCLPEPERQFRFCDGRKWAADFAWPAHLLLVECEGGSWNHGRHVRPAGFRDDCQKYNAAVLGGWKILRFTADMVESGEAVGMIEKVLNNRAMPKG